jgi:protease I
MKVLLVIAPENFRDEEYFEPKAVFRSKNFSTTTASKKTGNIQGMQGNRATSDITLNEVTLDYDAIVLVGGIGAKIYFDDEKLLEIVRDFHSRGKLVAAICISPTILANAGILEGKNATVWEDPELIDNLKEKGANYTGLDVTVDGRVITASGPKVAKEFGQEIANLLEG